MILVRIVAIVLTVVLVGVVAEGGSYLVVSFLSRNLRTKTLIYDPPSISLTEYENYLRRRDPYLGWPSPEEIGGARHDSSGSRRIPAFPEPGQECVTLYGDSFTYAADVSDAEAWSNVLSRLLACRVGNFGVGGYGTDQAYLRFERNSVDRAPFTLLGIYPDDAIRNLTRDAYLAFGIFPASFKPRFSYSQGKLVLLPMPTAPSDRLAEYSLHPEQFLEDDMLLPGTPNGPVRAQFPFFATLLRIAVSPRVQNWMSGRPSWMNIYTPGDPSMGLETMQGIVEKFAALCARRDKRCAVVLFPTPKSYAYFEKTGQSALTNLAQGMDRVGIRYLDFSPAISRELTGRRYCDLMTMPENCVGHFNAQGNELVAKLVHKFLLEERDMPGMLRRASR
jgi:hypothetical protein